MTVSKAPRNCKWVPAHAYDVQWTASPAKHGDQPEGERLPVVTEIDARARRR
eukprot:CAMPEP_0183342084 /NCGR_PEP_ID=MMETSP0164_2-20130417/8252_1 /TAXON_ID=221442 /ORGANISM="Coccolithus pelagicus ssp braarudi, Strain PLY182g" /LENGTH=51 /DNA_ID=CAMNT_0025512571 /DNA_START=663 /DNA_END=818 /DNA_ORIENTATION=+